MVQLQDTEAVLLHKYLIDCSPSFYRLNLMKELPLFHFAFVANQKDEFLADRCERASFQS